MNLTCNGSLPSFGGNFTIERTTNQTINGSICVQAITQPAIPPNPYEDFFKVAFGSSFFIIFVSLVTFLANSVLLYVFYIDPLKIFRNPTSYFLIGLAIVDLLTALVQEPVYATCFILLYFRNPLVSTCAPMMDATLYFASFTMTVSYLIIFAFTSTQYIVVVSPLKYGRLVTRRKVITSIGIIYIYAAVFWCSHLLGVPADVQMKMEVFIHNYFVNIVTIVLYALLHHAVKKKMAAGVSLQGESGGRGGGGGHHTRMQRHFVRANFLLLAILIVCSLPSSIWWSISLFLTDASPKILIVHLMVDNVLYLKFLLDPFVYAWRIPKYRESLRKSVRHQAAGRGAAGNETGRSEISFKERSENALSTSQGSTITLMSFKNLRECTE